MFNTCFPHRGIVRANPERSRFPVREEGQVELREWPNGLSANAACQGFQGTVNVKECKISSYLVADCTGETRRQRFIESSANTAVSKWDLALITARSSPGCTESYMSIGWVSCCYRFTDALCGLAPTPAMWYAHARRSEHRARFSSFYCRSLTDNSEHYASVLAKRLLLPVCLPQFGRSLSAARQ